jgi:cytosine/adenosine deaminase-related metal-dependent hydrolase
MSRQTLRARWIVPVTATPIENGCLSIDDGRIADVGRAAASFSADVDYGDAVILPGLVNAHAHLDLTAFGCCVPYLGSFTDWLRILVSMQTADGAEERMDQGIVDGLRASLAAGVTCIADIGCGDRALRSWSRTSANIIGFFEAIGMGPRRSDVHPRSLKLGIQHCQQARTACDREPSEGRRILITGLSPHAPYSTAPEVYREAIAYCRERRLPICTHLAETPAEAEFLAHGTGPFRKLLEERSLWDGSFDPPGCSPVQYAEALGLLDCRPLLAHGNYLSDEDIALLARRGCRVVYCPRTHRFFEHAPHRYRDLLAAGVNVCLGTDSLASSPSLSILDELRYLRDIDGDSPDCLLLEMATIRGARALGLESELGSLEPGKRADLLVLPLAADRKETWAQLLTTELRPQSVFVNGQQIADATR